MSIKKEPSYKTNYILIDYENTQPKRISLPSTFPFKVIIFVGSKQTKLPIELVASMQSIGENGKYIRINGSGKNALDFHLTFYLGQLCNSDNIGYYHIISKDTGFDILINHLREQSISIQRYNNIEDIPPLKIPAAKTITDKINIIVDYLIKRGNAKPRKILTLSNTIHSLFMRELSQDEISKIITKMTNKKLIIIDGTKVQYKLQ